MKNGRKDSLWFGDYWDMKELYLCLNSMTSLSVERKQEN